MQELYKNFLHEDIPEDQDTLTEQTSSRTKNDAVILKISPGISPTA